MMACTSNCQKRDINSSNTVNLRSLCSFDSIHSPREKCIVVIYNGGGEEFTASTRVKKITSGPYNGYKHVYHAQPYLPLPRNTKLKPLAVSDEVIGDNSSRVRSVKIVVTKQRLELLLRSAKQFRSNGNAVQFMRSFCVGEERRKWQPSLATIPELQNLLE